MKFIDPRIGYSLMNSFVKNIFLMLNAALLTACGSSSSDSKGVEPYSLDDYQGRAVSSSTLAGTWVSVSSGEVNYSGDFGDVYEEFSSKAYFIIRATHRPSYKKASCFSGFYDIEQEEGDEFSFEGIKGTFTNNNSFSGDRQVEFQSEDSPAEHYSESSYERFQMIKISDGVEAIGAVSTTIAEDEVIMDEAICFQQTRRRMHFINSEIDGIHNEAGFVVGVDDGYQLSMWEWDGNTADLAKTMFVQGQDFSSTDGNDTDFTVNYESNSSHNITFSTSDKFREIRGDVKIQLPSY